MKLILLFTILITSLPAAAKLKLKSDSLKTSKMMSDKFVYNKFGCSGENISPALQWENAPEATKSFAITVFDPDAPTGSGWWHWIVANIPNNISKLEEGSSNKNSLPMGAIEGRTDFGNSGYGGPCPPKGETHRYIFTVYALKVDKINVDQETSGALMGFNIKANELDSASITIKYGR